MSMKYRGEMNLTGICTH